MGVGVRVGMGVGYKVRVKRGLQFRDFGLGRGWNGGWVSCQH